MSDDFFKKLAEKAKPIGARIVFPEGDDARVISAAVQLRDEGIATPILLGVPGKIEAAAQEASADVSGISIIDPKTSACLEVMAADYCARRKNVKERVALRLMKRNLFYSCMMVHMGDADGMVGGAASPTTSVLQSAGLAIGYADGTPCPSSIMLMRVPNLNRDVKYLAFADPAVTVDPTSEELASIAIESGRNFRRFTGEKPRVAFLSFSTQGSAAHPNVDKVREALRLAHELKPDFHIDGELQADTALSRTVADKKMKQESKVAGRANVLVFPDLNSANIAYKLTQYLGGADAIGPILQGFRKPVNDLSRGATAQDIYQVSILTALQTRDD